MLCDPIPYDQTVIFQLIDVSVTELGSPTVSHLNA